MSGRRADKQQREETAAEPLQRWLRALMQFMDAAQLSILIEGDRRHEGRNRTTGTTRLGRWLDNRFGWREMALMTARVQAFKRRVDEHNREQARQRFLEPLAGIIGDA